MDFLTKLVRGLFQVGQKVWDVGKRLGQGVFDALTSFVTFGGSLSLDGATGGGGGWSGAIRGVMDAIGLGGTSLGNILGGAVEYAGYGALGGAAVAAVTGGDIGKGAAQGALALGALGGVQGAMGGGGILNQVSPTAPPSSGPFGPPQGADIGAGASMAASNGGSLNRLFEPGGWMERNAGIVGPVIGGVGEGLLTKMATEDEIASAERRQQMRQHNPKAGFVNPVREEPLRQTGERWRRPREDINESRTGTMHPSNIY